MAARIICPTCGMSASSTDHRQFRPVINGDDNRVCRNCGAEVSPIDLDRRALLHDLTIDA